MQCIYGRWLQPAGGFIAWCVESVLMESYKLQRRLGFHSIQMVRTVSGLHESYIVQLSSS